MLWKKTKGYEKSNMFAKANEVNPIVGYLLGDIEKSRNNRP
jgi:hypothetical protein